MRRFYLSALAALVFAAAWAGGASAQDTSTITAAEMARHGWPMPGEKQMLVVITHTGSEDPVTCALHDEGVGLREDLGEIKNGEEKPFGVNTDQLVGQFWVQCVVVEGRHFSSNNIHSVAQTVVHFSTGAKFIIQQRIKG